MDDLISRRALISRFKQLQGSDTLANMFVSDVIKEVKNQPTAYNVDKVIQEIENLKDLDNREKHCVETKELNKCGDFDDCEQCILEKAISFVKAGGVNG